jgi:hypothetical protein
MNSDVTIYSLGQYTTTLLSVPNPKVWMHLTSLSEEEKSLIVDFLFLSLELN